LGSSSYSVLRHSRGSSFRQDALQKLKIIPRDIHRIVIGLADLPTSPQIKLEDGIDEDDRSPTQSLDGSASPDVASPCATENSSDRSQEIGKRAVRCH
jgi:hypothetical protein